MEPPVEHQKTTAANGKSLAQPTAKPATKARDTLGEARAAAQDLHRVLSDAVAKRGGALKTDLEALPQKAKAIVTGLRSSMTAQHADLKEHLSQAVEHLEAFEKDLAESGKNTGQAFEASVRHALASVRAAIQNISEAVASKRTAASTHAAKQ